MTVHATRSAYGGAIQTRYAGCHFRSRLEARWAVFLDTLGVPWEYEPQGFEWGANEIDAFAGKERVEGGRYLPDFWLPSIKTWFEVKGATPTDDEHRVHREFALVTGDRHVTAFGDIPRSVDELETCTEWMTSMILNGGADNHYLWCVCPSCDKFGIEFDGRGARVCGRSTHGKLYGDKAYTYDDPRILFAYEQARSARFEHGQSGAT